MKVVVDDRRSLQISKVLEGVSANSVFYWCFLVGVLQPAAISFSSVILAYIIFEI